MKILVLTIFIASLWTAPALAHFGTKCHVANREYCHITLVSPHLGEKFALRLARAVKTASKKYNVPASTLIAILGQESSFRLGAVGGEVCGYIRNHSGKYRLGCMGKDFGIGQQSHKTIERYAFDVNLLLVDLQYSVNAAAEVLSWFHRTYSRTEKDWYLRYNCGTRSSIERRSCKRYKKAIARWMWGAW